MSLDQIITASAQLGNVMKPLVTARAESSLLRQEAAINRANANISAYNADIARSNAAQEASAEQTRQEQMRTVLRRQLGENISARAASGVTLDSGSVYDAFADQAMQGELGLALSRYESLTRQRAFNQQARSQDFEAQLRRNIANVGMSNARRSVLTGALQSASKLPDAYKNMMKKS